jgi:hypothetical protein
MFEIVLLFLGSVLGFAHAAKSWLALRKKEGKRCVPKYYLWHGVRNLVLSLAVFVLIFFSGGTSGGMPSPPSAGVALFGGVILFALGFGIGNGLSNVFGGTLSYVTNGPNQPSTDGGSTKPPKTDEYGQFKE